MNDLVYLWVGSAPENNSNFSDIQNDDQITELGEGYNVSFTNDLKAASPWVGIMSGQYPSICCTCDKRIGLNNIQLHPRYRDIMIPRS